MGKGFRCIKQAPYVLWGEGIALERPNIVGSRVSSRVRRIPKWDQVGQPIVAQGHSRPLTHCLCHITLPIQCPHQRPCAPPPPPPVASPPTQHMGQMGLQGPSRGCLPGWPPSATSITPMAKPSQQFLDPAGPLPSAPMKHATASQVHSSPYLPSQPWVAGRSGDQPQPTGPSPCGEGLPLTNLTDHPALTWRGLHCGRSPSPHSPPHGGGVGTEAVPKRRRH